MKKVYEQPMMAVVNVHGESILVLSDGQMEVNSENKVSSTSNIGFVKGESSRGSHSVWDDDWSKE